MYKISLLAGQEVVRTIFDESHIDTLKTLGELTINPNEARNQAPETIKQLISNADIAITSWGCPRLDKEILDCAPNLKVVLHAAGTVKPIVSPEFWQRGIRITSSAEALGIGVAESALAMTIASLKFMWRLSQDTRNGEWRLNKDKVREIFDITIGVVGAGHAGRNYIRLLRNFEVRILLYDPTLSAEQVQQLGAQKVELDELMKLSDVVSIHAPSIPATYRMINKERLMMMKDDAILINTARGAIIDEQALIEELKKGRLYACLDVTDPEPPAVDHPFRSLPNVTLLPHIAGASSNGRRRIANFVIEDLKRFMKGEKMEGEVVQQILNIIA